MIEIGEITPDTIYGTDPDKTFIYTANHNLYLANGHRTHGELIEQNKKLALELNELLGTDITSGGQIDWSGLRSYIKNKPLGILGRFGTITDRFNHVQKVCAFWNNPALARLVQPCVGKLLKDHLISNNYLISLPGTIFSYNAEEFLKLPVKNPTASQVIQNNKVQAMHLLKGKEKKQALQYAGASPTPRNPSLNPGEKYWALNSENFSFKDWLEMCGTGVVFDPKQKPKEDWNWQGAPGKTGVSPKQDPIKKKKK